ncbi:hypothetical protein DFH06DRAFT_347582 [Mycena polygramma]|nr:hypothetical protein DFH06DRAFT_347582 [Mycena polygramma]
MSHSKILITGLLDPMNHDSCCLFQLLESVRAIQWHSTDKDPMCPPELLRAIMQFLLTPDTSDKLSRLVDRLRSCDCVLAETVNFTTGVATPMEPLRCLDMVFSYLCGFLYARLISLKRSQFRSCKAGRTTVRQPWPNCVADIGLADRTPHEAVTILLRWSWRPPFGHSVLPLLGILARFWEPYGLEMLGNPDVAPSVRLQLEGSLKTFDDDVHRVWDSFEKAVESCRLLGLDLGLVAIQLAQTKTEFEEELYDMGVPLIPLLVKRGERMRPALQWFSTMIRSRHGIVPGAIERGGDPLLHDDDYFQARYQMAMSHCTHRCGHALCDKSPTLSVIPLCRQCCVVRYCSRQCQTAAWRAEKLPHKDLCGKVLGLRQQLGMPDDKSWTLWLLTSASNIAGAATICKERSVRRRTCRAIWLHIMWLRREKKLIPQTQMTNVKALRAQSLNKINTLFELAGQEL